MVLVGPRLSITHADSETFVYCVFQCQRILTLYSVPSGFKVSYLVPIPKLKDTQYFRPIFVIVSTQGRLHHRKLGANAPKKFQGGKI